MCRSAVAVWLMFLIVFTAAGQTADEQLERFFRAGQQALQQREFARAVEAFKKVLALHPDLVEAEVNLGLAYQSLFEYDLAVRYLAKALHERSNLLGPTVIVGMDYLKLGSPAKAIPFLEQAVKLNSPDLESREALATAYLTEEQFGNAAEQFRQIALLRSDKSEAWFKLGHEYLNLAARLAFRGAHRYGDSAWGHRFLGDLLYQRERWQEAAAEYQKGIAAEPQQSGLNTALGEAYLHTHKLDDAEKEFHVELQLDPKSETALFGLASVAIARTQGPAALECLQKVWDISPETVVLQRDFLFVDLPPQLLTAYIEAVTSEPDSAVRHLLLASLYTNANESASADRESEAFQKSFVTWQQGWKANAAGAQPEAAPCTEHHYSRCVDSLQARKRLTDAERLLLGKALYALQRYQPAAEALADIQGVSNENAEASYWLARTYQAQAAEAYAHLQESFPESWRTYQLRAEGSAIRGNVNDALTQYRAALQLRPNEPELYEALGEFYLEQHNDDEAQSALEKALVLDPSRVHALYLLGRLYVQNKENEKALPYLQNAVRLQPELAEANSLLGTVYVRLGQFAEAVPRLEKAAASDHYGNVHYQLYLAYRKLGRTDLAQKELGRSHDLRQRYLERDQALIMGLPRPESESQ